MLTLYPVFSDHALFQASSVLTLRGKTNPCSALSAAIMKNNTAVMYGSAVSDQNGDFALSLSTPPASFDCYTITVTCGEEQVILTDIQFGELWIATGQSNMEMSNYHQPECHALLEEMKGSGVRVYSLQYQKEGAEPNAFSITPEDDIPGTWLNANTDDLIGVSACATAFTKDIAAYFREIGKKIPVGFLNVSWGGTPIYGWIPMDTLRADARAMQLFEKHGRLPFEEKFNSYGDGNFQQPAVMYNRKIAPVRGLKARGVLWYQGENECGIEWNERIYAHFLRLLYGNFVREFASDISSFPMISVLIYPWVYGQSGETMRGYVNAAFVKTAREEPEHFIICPIDDLPPVWAANLENHPIHPAHKYRVGSRMAQLALSNVYGKAGQRAPATLDRYEISGDRLILHFSDVGSGLSIHGGQVCAGPVDGLFIAGENGHYMPAECKILSPNTMEVYHPYLSRPVHCAYDISSFACGANLFAGTLPVAPFATAIEEPGMLKIEALPFLNPDITRVWEAHIDAAGRLDVYYHPVWKPLFDCEVCQDDAFAERVCGMEHSIRISGGQNPIGAFVSSSEYHSIELYKYTALEMDVFHRGNISGYLELCYAEENGVSTTIKRHMTAIDGAPYTFRRYTVDLTGLPEKRIETVKFIFHVDDAQNMTYINIAKLILKP